MLGVLDGYSTWIGGKKQCQLQDTWEKQHELISQNILSVKKNTVMKVQTVIWQKNDNEGAETADHRGFQKGTVLVK